MNGFDYIDATLAKRFLVNLLYNDYCPEDFGFKTEYSCNCDGKVDHDCFECWKTNVVNDKYLIIGVEDGWIKTDNETWKEYLRAKERLNSPMEIHFYESKDYYPENCEILHDYTSVEKAISNRLPIIHTTQMCELKVTYLHFGYRIFVHQDDGFMYEITLISKNNHGQRAVRPSQNIYGMWANGALRECNNTKKTIRNTKGGN